MMNFLKRLMRTLPPWRGGPRPDQGNCKPRKRPMGTPPPPPPRSSPPPPPPGYFQALQGADSITPKPGEVVYVSIEMPTRRIVIRGGVVQEVQVRPDGQCEYVVLTHKIKEVEPVTVGPSDIHTSYNAALDRVHKKLKTMDSTE